MPNWSAREQQRRLAGHDHIKLGDHSDIGASDGMARVQVPPGGIDHVGKVHGFERIPRDLRALAREAQQQQRLHQFAHGSHLLRGTHEPRAGRGRGPDVAERKVELARENGERSAQLVRSVGGELALRPKLFVEPSQ